MCVLVGFELVAVEIMLKKCERKTSNNKFIMCYELSNVLMEYEQ